jgi:hypothetical protein
MKCPQSKAFTRHRLLTPDTRALTKGAILKTKDGRILAYDWKYRQYHRKRS